MPPLQSRGQLRWNTKYALDNEADFEGVRKRWILNRIWNQTELRLIQKDMEEHHVSKEDILLRQFEIEEFSKYKTNEDKMLYVTSQNEARNDAIIHGRNDGFDWIVILDGNTFITLDGWKSLEYGLKNAELNQQQYLKIPYHRLHHQQHPNWLNTTTTMDTALRYAPNKGESQVAFHRSASELFSLGDTKPENQDKGKPSKGYGQRNKSYMFKDGAICGPDSTHCACASVVEGNEQDVDEQYTRLDEQLKYTRECGLILRLWNFPTQNVIQTGLTKDEEDEGFFCFLSDSASKIKHTSQCGLMEKSAKIWKSMSSVERSHYREFSDVCREEYSTIFLKESCFRALDRDIAQFNTLQVLDYLSEKNKENKCFDHYLTVFNSKTLDLEREMYLKKQSIVQPMMNTLFQMADRGMALGPYSVTDKLLLPDRIPDSHYYYSVRPYYWPVDAIPSSLQEQLDSSLLVPDSEGFVHLDGYRLPGTVIGDSLSENYDRARAWYLVDNVTTLSLAWYFSRDPKYACKAASLVSAFFIDDATAMRPNLMFSQDGSLSGSIDWKDMYYLVDSFSILQSSGALSCKQVVHLQNWCKTLGEWLTGSVGARHEAFTSAKFTALRSNDLYFDLTVLSLFLYGGRQEEASQIMLRLSSDLSEKYPHGPFGKEGSQPHECKRATALHYVTFNLIGWIHVALVTEEFNNHHARLSPSQSTSTENQPSLASSTLSPSPSLFSIRHQDDPPDSPPVLMKAIRWISKYLPTDPSFYDDWVSPAVRPSSKSSHSSTIYLGGKAGMGVNFPFNQSDSFSFDRMLEIVQYGINIYGVDALFPIKTDAIKLALKRIKTYAVTGSSFSKYSSVHPDSGSRAWSRLGMIVRSSSSPPYHHSKRRKLQTNRLRNTNTNTSRTNHISEHPPSRRRLHPSNSLIYSLGLDLSDYNKPQSTICDSYSFSSSSSSQSESPANSLYSTYFFDSPSDQKDQLQQQQSFTSPFSSLSFVDYSTEFPEIVSLTSSFTSNSPPSSLHRFRSSLSIVPTLVLFMIISFFF